MRIIFIIPRMFTENELSKINSVLPEDFEQRSKEFWDYVEEKLRTQPKVHKLYFDSLTNEKEDALDFVKKSCAKCYELVSKYIQRGAVIEITEDQILVEEASSWASMLQNDEKTALASEDMLAKNMVDRDKFIAKRISESLRDGETGILFLSPGRRTSEYLPQEIRAIKIQPFDPADYLNSWVTTISIKSTKQNNSS
jgi:hypothetical protein